ncbi:hypothetical protein LQW54_010550 [Pestalotiopsis sp. IQ-011]
MSDISPNISMAAYEGDLLAVRRAIEAVPPLSQELLDRAATEALRGRHLDIFRYLLENGVSDTSDIVTSAACRARSSEVFQIMYDHGWQAEQINVAMISIHVMSTNMHSRSTAEWLLDYGLNPNLEGERGLIHWRCGKSTPINVLALLGTRDTDVIEVMQLLISRSATVDPFVLENAIARRVARRVEPHYQLEVLQWLVDHGADVNYPMQRRDTMIFRAVASKNLQLVEFLLRNGADTSFRRTYDRKTPLEVARILGAQQEIPEAI